MTGNDGKRRETAGNDRKRPETTGWMDGWINRLGIRTGKTRLPDDVSVDRGEEPGLWSLYTGWRFLIPRGPIHAISSSASPYFITFHCCD